MMKEREGERERGIKVDKYTIKLKEKHKFR
jgi:hypothetical protein